MKILFISPQKVFLFSRYLHFCIDFLVMQKYSLIRKIKLISKLRTSRLGKETITIHILPNISRRKEKQAIFGQLIEYNTRNNCLEESFKSCGGETIQRPFFKKSKLTIPLDQCSKVLYSFFLLNAKLRAIKIY